MDAGGIVKAVCDYEEGLSDEVLRQLDMAPELTHSDDETQLPNGMPLGAYLALRGITIDVDTTGINSQALRATVSAADTLPPTSDAEQRRNDVIAKMVKAAKDFACGRAESGRCTKWDREADPTSTAKDPKPGQQGLTYIYGGKNPYERTRPIDGCRELTYGMDCSGLVAQLALQVGISLPAKDALQQGDAGNWKPPSDWQIKMQTVGDGTIETGDILAWSTHIGIADVAGSEVAVISSTGHKGECAYNIVPKAGPRSMPLEYLTATKLGKPALTLRLTAMGGGGNGGGTPTTATSTTSTSSTTTTTINSAILYYYGCPPLSEATISVDGAELETFGSGEWKNTGFVVAANTTYSWSCDGCSTFEFTTPAVFHSLNYCAISLYLIMSGPCGLPPCPQ